MLNIKRPCNETKMEGMKMFSLREYNKRQKQDVIKDINTKT